MNEAGVAGKRAMRKHMLARRDALGQDVRACLSEAITQKLVSMAKFDSARTVSSYASFGSEFETASLNASVLANGKRLLLPRVDRGNNKLIFHTVTDLATGLQPGTWGIMEPDPQVCPGSSLAEVDLMLVPGLAFTAQCERLGYGGGFYDGVIDAAPASTNKIAVAFAVQMVKELVVEPHDRMVDIVLTENAIYHCEKRRA